MNIKQIRNPVSLDGPWDYTDALYLLNHTANNIVKAWYENKEQDFTLYIAALQRQIRETDIFLAGIKTERNFK